MHPTQSLGILKKENVAKKTGQLALKILFFFLFNGFIYDMVKIERGLFSHLNFSGFNFTL